MATLFAIDVECVSTGTGHNDSAPCRVGIVDADGTTILDATIAVPPKEIYDPLTLITGLSLDDIARGSPLADLRTQVREIVHVATLVGHAIYNDMGWLGLE